MSDQIHEQELNHLHSTKNIVGNASNELELSLKQLGSENLEKLKELRSETEGGIDFVIFLDKLHEQNIAFNLKDKYRKLDELTFLEKEPYFSRIDLKNPKNGQVEKIYIGKFGHTEKEKPIITDWRAKIASVYYRYRYPQNNIQYETPVGVETRDLLLKRTFEIDDGNLIKYYNNDLKLDEKEIILEKIEQRTGGVLEDIVETIQESQMDIIESDPRKICIVQGCVGSGKSTVAIHKLSHIFFNYSDLIHPGRSILIAKNQILVGYLSTLFPKLGIFDINYGTVRDIVYKLVFTEKMNIDIDLNKNLDVSTYTLSKINNLREEVQKVHEKYENELEDIFSEDEFETFGGFVYSKDLPVLENIEEIISEIEEELDFQQEILKSESINPRRELLHKKNVKSLKKLIRQLRKTARKVRDNTLSQLAKNENLFKEEKLGYLEALIYVFLYSELIGFKNLLKYEYCVVDEGQDFGLFEYLVLSKIVLNGRFCILGDLNQCYTKEGLREWEEITSIIKEAKNATTFELDTNYRSTKQIIDCANKIMSPFTNKYLPNSINRMGGKPTTKKFKTYNDMIVDFIDNIKDDIKNLDKSVGIISFNPLIISEIKKILLDLGVPVEKLKLLQPNERVTYIPQGVYLMEFENCKGLEFAKVYVLDLDLDKISNSTNAKKAFVAVTRAMNELTVYSIEDES